jgi:hypothetical protein
VVVEKLPTYLQGTICYPQSIVVMQLEVEEADPGRSAAKSPPGRGGACSKQHLEQQTRHKEPEHAEQRLLFQKEG